LKWNSDLLFVFEYWLNWLLLFFWSRLGWCRYVIFGTWNYCIFLNKLNLTMCFWSISKVTSWFIMFYPFADSSPKKVFYDYKVIRIEVTFKDDGESFIPTYNIGIHTEHTLYVILSRCWQICHSPPRVTFHQSLCSLNTVKKSTKDLYTLDCRLNCNKQIYLINFFAKIILPGWWCKKDNTITFRNTIWILNLVNPRFLLS
jgi:hypothetical protein